MPPIPPEFNRPSQADCRAACDALAGAHGLPSARRAAGEKREGCELPGPHTVLDSLVRTILSQNTTDVTSQRAFASLKAAFPDWQRVRTATTADVADAIRVGGLADIKAARIQAILESVLRERGSLSLEHLRQLPEEDAKQELLAFNGVGPKTAACVLMFCLQRAEFPVDVHVWTISKQLGWVPPAATREQAYLHLNSRVPDDIKYDLHVLMVQHGKVCASCGQKRGKGDAFACPLAPLKRRCRGGGGGGGGGGVAGAESSEEEEEAAAVAADGTTATATAAAGAAAFKVKREADSPQRLTPAGRGRRVGAAGSAAVAVKPEPQPCGGGAAAAAVVKGEGETASTPPPGGGAPQRRQGRRRREDEEERDEEGEQGRRPRPRSRRPQGPGK